jgi:RNA methyltransferase, TrmH family
MACGHRPQAIFVRAALAEELVERIGLAEGVFGSAVGAGAGVLPRGADPSLAVYPVSEQAAKRLSTLETPPDVMAVFSLPERRPLSVLREPAGSPPDALLLVYVDGVADPGNMGTLVRAAVAFGATALAAAPGSVDLYGPKTVRSSMGAVFGLPLFADVALGDVVSQLHVDRVYGLAAHGGVPLPTAGLRRPAVLVVGAERPGLSAEVLTHVSQLITIPLGPGAPGVVESLNAGVAGAIALYELSRSRPPLSSPTAWPSVPNQ